MLEVSDLSYFDINILTESEPMITYSFGIFILVLIGLCFLSNIILYLIAILFINYYQLSERYPRLHRLLSIFAYNSLF